ncbi:MULTISPECIES: MarR family transcriptional regulator [Achromobacter]|uniref:MarR family transcriptional regulator n=1 Tax=Achromobacter TaxID=222 RepID=UPI0028AADBCC|nr:MarR family transcriptional regulator [Achromobacter animicus]
MSTEEVSPEQAEWTRKTGERLRAEFGTAVAAFTQVRAAKIMGTSPSSVSRIVTDDLEGLCHLMAAMGYQFAPLDAMVVSKEKLEALELFTYEYLRSKIESRRQ